MEKWDLYDKDRKPLFRKHQRGKKLNAGEYHIVVQIWTVNSEGKILLTLRDSSKKDYPNKWENSGGSVLSGETSREGALRELEEETGIVAKEKDLMLLGTYREPHNFFDYYLLHHDIECIDLRLQVGETVDAKWVTLDELEKMIEDESLAIPIGKTYLRFKERIQEEVRDIF